MILILSVHPHAGGENEQMSFTGFLAWRFTPTRVGKTLRKHKQLRVWYGSPPRGWGKRAA